MGIFKTTVHSTMTVTRYFKWLVISVICFVYSHFRHFTY